MPPITTPNSSHDPHSLGSTHKKSGLNLLFLSILLGIWFIIAAMNFPKDAFLTGWDNLHPEFNIAESLKRAVFGVWQEHQGLGHVGGHGYAAVLPHTIMIAILGIFFSLNLVRVIFTLLTLLAGALGCYFLIRLLLRSKNLPIQLVVALLGAVFYMVNFATIQQFYIQLEAFIIHFAVLPWLLYLTLSMLHSWTKKKVVLFAFISFIGSTQGFIPPLFVIYFISLSSLLFFYLLSNRTIQSFQKALIIGLITFCVNSYWLLPALQYTLTGSSAFLNSTNNRLSTQGWVDTNDSYGTIDNLSILRGFPSQSIDSETISGTKYIFQPWLNHLNSPLVGGIGMGIFLIICLGVIVFIKNQKPRYHIAFVILIFFMFSLLATQVPILSSVSKFIQQLPLFKQAFRAGFTKVSIALALYYAVFFAYGACFFIELLHKMFRRFDKVNVVSFVGGGLLLCFVLYFSFPIFQGHLFYKKASIAIPPAYFELFSFFDGQQNTDRIALLPQGTHWGWDTYKWGYTGSGFMWFGLPQPILERAFDVWSSVSENYYWELTQVLFSSNVVQLDNIIDKYQIKWVIIDESFIPFYGTKYPISADKTIALITSSPRFKLEKKISLPHGQSIYIYKTQLKQADNTHISIYKNISTTSQPFSWTTHDLLYEKTQGYKTQNTPSIHSLNFPFGSLFSTRDQSELSFAVKENSDSFTISTNISNSNRLLTIPPYSLRGLDLEPIMQDVSKYASPSYFISIDNQQVQEIENSKTLPTSVKLYGNEKRLAVTIPKLQYYSSYNSDKPGAIQPNIAQCSDPNKNAKVVFNTQKIQGGFVTNLENISSSTCYDLFIPNASQKYGYILMVESKNIEGNPLLFTLINGTTRRNDVETYLPAKNIMNTSTIIIPPKALDGLGYSLRFSNISISNRKSINNLGKIILYPIPYDFITSIKTSSQNTVSTSSVVQSNLFSVEHSSSFLYKIQIPTYNIQGSDPTITLNQGFDEGWKAYEMNEEPNWLQSNFPFLFGTELKEHVLINNWANGWALDSSKPKAESLNRHIVILFLPQYLQFIGFGLLGLTFLGILLYRPKNEIDRKKGV